MRGGRWLEEAASEMRKRQAKKKRKRPCDVCQKKFRALKRHEKYCSAVCKAKGKSELRKFR